MITYLESILVQLYIGGMLVASGGCLWGIRRLARRARIVRGERG
ncbi:hypothetical protein ACTJKS_15005 [Pseudomonas sp. 22189]